MVVVSSSVTSLEGERGRAQCVMPRGAKAQLNVTDQDKTRQDKGCLDLAAPHDRIALAKATALLRQETQDTSAK